MSINAVYFDKSVLFGVNREKWNEFWWLARQMGIRGYYTPITYVEITSRLFEEFEQNKRCFELIRDADLGILEHPEICIARYVLGPEGIPQELLREEEINLTVFKGTPDFIVSYCKAASDLNRGKIINTLNCSSNLRKMIQKLREVRSKLLFIVSKPEGPRFLLKFDFNYIEKYRKRYEVRSLNDMWKMREIINKYLESYMKESNIEKPNIPFAVRIIEKTPEFAKFFLDALFDRAAGFIFDSKSFCYTLPRKWDEQEVYRRLRPLNAFYEGFKNLTIKELTGGIEKNDYADLLLLVYIGKGFHFITNDLKLSSYIESSSQRSQVMTFDDALQALKRQHKNT